MNVIVVGVDGSEHSLTALRHAIREARAHDATVRAVGVWHVPALAYDAPLPLPTGDLAAELRDDAHTVLGAALESVRDELGEVQVELAVREGDPGHVLVAESEGALQLVVGSRGRGNIGELLLGSVSHYCSRHAHCPVTVIPRTATDRPS